MKKFKMSSALFERVVAVVLMLGLVAGNFGASAFAQEAPSEPPVDTTETPVVEEVTVDDPVVDTDEPEGTTDETTENQLPPEGQTPPGDTTGAGPADEGSVQLQQQSVMPQINTLCETFLPDSLSEICNPGPTTTTTGTVTIYKYIKNGQGVEALAQTGAPSFPMQSTWNATSGSGSGNYNLAAPTYSAETSEMAFPYDYTTSEVTDGNPVLGPQEACQADKYRLVGYRTGDSLDDAEDNDISTSAPNIEDASTDKYIIVVNEDCDDLPQAPQMCTLVSDDEDTYVGGVPATLTYEHPAWLDEGTDGAEWVWDSFHVTNPTQAQTLTFSRTFSSSAAAAAATLEIAADNVYSVEVNGVPQAACNAQGATEPNYAATETCTIPVVAGVNVVKFTVTNHAGSSDPEQNPAGLYYKITVPDASCTDLPPTATVTMCKVSDNDEEGMPGWQLYLKGNNVQDDLVVPSTDPAGVDSNPLTTGMNYLVSAFGTWTNRTGSQTPNLVDAEYSSDDSWATHMDGYTGFGNTILELEINQTDTAWGPYNNAHAYSQVFTPGSTGPANFRMFDGDTHPAQKAEWFADNSGSLLVDIDEAYTGTTGEGGCVTLENVPYGTYTAGEIAQEGWELEEVYDGEELVDGSTVTVDDAEETFTLVNEEQSCTIVSDSTTLEGGTSSYELDPPFHPSWTAFVDALAEWIWGDDGIQDPVGDTTQVFTKTFTLDSAPTTDATLEIAADNSYVVRLNGVEVGSDLGEVNYTAGGQDTITIPANKFTSGTNTLEFTVKNFAMANGTEETNPAGLMYKLTVPGRDCDEGEDAEATLVIVKHTENGEGTFTFNIDEVEENFAPAEDVENPESVDITTEDTMGSSGPIELTPGTYDITEQVPENWDLDEDSTYCDYDNEEIGEQVDNGYRVYLDAGDYVTCHFYDVKVAEQNQVKVHIYKYLWEESRDEGGEAVPVPNGAGIPDFPMTATWQAANLNGGVESSATYVLGNNHGGNPSEYGADTSPMDAPADYTTSEITDGSVVVANSEECEEGKYVLLGYKSGNTLAQAEAAAIQSQAPEYEDLTSDRYIIVVNEECEGDSPGDGEEYATLTIVKHTTGGDGSFEFDVTQQGEISIGDVDGSILLVTEDGVATSSPIVLDPGYYYDVTETVPEGWDLDEEATYCVYDGESAGTSVPNGERIYIYDEDDDVTCHFYNTATEQSVTTTGGGGGGGGSRSARRDSEGSVLGASTDGQVLGNACPLLEDYMREGMNNDPAQVSLLQAFLNGEVGSSLVVDGVFDALTTAAVNVFQFKYQPEVLAPWGQFGYDPNTPTGYVFKTTLWKINDIACPELDAPFPQLP